MTKQAKLDRFAEKWKKEVEPTAYGVLAKHNLSDLLAGLYRLNYTRISETKEDCILANGYNRCLEQIALACGLNWGEISK